jgi:hypothetical protein
VITTRNGDRFTGIFSASPFEPGDSTFIIKMVQRPATQSDQSRSNTLSDAASPFLSSPPDHSMAFDMKEIADVQVTSVFTTEVAAKEQNGL